ncbi:MAG: hypothetical protein HBSAPP03_14490 [Phycisphaerae bacterium]|nr:MAG: hypothetical protein HBSAPP03_14490 [Phycisphaerae bacterium]
MSITRTVFLSLPSLAACSALAQGPMPERIVPLNLMWQNQGTNVPNDPRFAAMQAVNVHVASDYFPYQNNPTPENAANLVCDMILVNKAAGRISNDTVCVVLRGLGHDAHQSQPEWVAPATFCPPPDPQLPQGPRFLPPLGFFRPETDALPGVTPASFHDKPFPEILRFPMQCGDNQQMDARAWRHPFTVNATGASELKAWMQAFVARVNVRVAGNSNLPRPNTWRFYLDTEPHIFLVAARNGVFIPHHLATQHGVSGSIWDTWKVPGSPGWVPPADSELNTPGTPHGFASTTGMTLQQLFAAEATRHGWDVNDPESAFNPLIRADAPTNRAAMLWWMNIWAKAAEEILRNSCYSVLKQAWTGVRYGNWDMSSVDGETDTTGWYVDWNQTPPPYTNGMTVSNTLKRCVIDPSPAAVAPPYTRHPVNNGNYDLWAGIEQRSTGTADCPFLYPLNCSQYAGLYNCTIPTGVIGHRQHNLWSADPDDLETISQTTIRLNRHTVESIINSYGGGRQTRLVPWVPQFVGDLEQLPNDPIAYYTDEAAQRALFAMLRGKNVGELLQWSAAGTVPAQEAAWLHTMDLMTRVYCAKVTDIKPMGCEQADPNDNLEPPMVEFTLRDPTTHDDYTADLVPAVWSSMLGTCLRVTFEGLRDHPPAPTYQCPDNGCTVLKYEVIIEGKVVGATAQTHGVVEFARWDETGDPPALTQSWVPEYAFDVVTPDGSFRNTFPLPNWQAYIEQDGTALMRIRMLDPSNDFTTKHDLAQMIPYWECVACGDPEDEGEGFAAADLNADGSVSPEDFNLFVAALIRDNTLADVNSDNQLDGEDVAAFEASYATNTP